MRKNKVIIDVRTNGKGGHNQWGHQGPLPFFYPQCDCCRPERKKPEPKKDEKKKDELPWPTKVALSLIGVTIWVPLNIMTLGMAIDYFQNAVK